MGHSPQATSKESGARRRADFVDNIFVTTDDALDDSAFSTLLRVRGGALLLSMSYLRQTETRDPDAVQRAGEILRWLRERLMENPSREITLFVPSNATLGDLSASEIKYHLGVARNFIQLALGFHVTVHVMCASVNVPSRTLNNLISLQRSA